MDDLGIRLLRQPEGSRRIQATSLAFLLLTPLHGLSKCEDTSTSWDHVPHIVEALGEVRYRESVGQYLYTYQAPLAWHLHFSDLRSISRDVLGENANLFLKCNERFEDQAVTGYINSAHGSYLVELRSMNGRVFVTETGGEVHPCKSCNSSRLMISPPFRFLKRHEYDLNSGKYTLRADGDLAAIARSDLTQRHHTVHVQLQGTSIGNLRPSKVDR